MMSDQNKKIHTNTAVAARARASELSVVRESGRLSRHTIQIESAKPVEPRNVAAYRETQCGMKARNTKNKKKEKGKYFYHGVSGVLGSSENMKSDVSHLFNYCL